jgi:hypothetical protein
MQLSYGYLATSNVFFLAFGPEQAKNLAGMTSETSLAANKTYAAAMKEVDGENRQLAVFVDIARARALAVQAAAGGPPPGEADPDAESPSDQTKKMLHAFGVDGITTLAATIRVVDKGMLAKTRLRTPGPHRGVLSLFSGPALTEADLSHVPEDADFLLAGSLSPKRMIEALKTAVGDVDPQQVERMGATMKELGEMLELDIEKDLLASLGDAVVLSSARSQGGFITGTLLTVEVTDEETAQRCLKQAATVMGKQLARSGGSIDSVQIAGKEMYALTFPKGGEDALMALRPTWGIHEGRLYLALWPQVIASSIANQTPPLTNQKRFAEFRKRMGTQASWISYTNTPELVRSGYGSQMLVGSALVNALGGRAQDAPMYPGSFQDATRYVWPDLGSCSADEDGITFESYGSSPVSTVSPATLALMASIALPALGQAREKARTATSQAKLRAIGTAAQMYAVERDGKLPADFEALIADGFIQASMLRSPHSEGPPPAYDKEKKALDGPLDYVLLDWSGRRTDTFERPWDFLLAYEQLEGSDEIPAAFLDGHVELVTQARLKALLAEAAKMQGEK